MKGNGRQMLEGAWDVVEQSLTDPLFWAERMLPGLFFLVLGGLLGSFLNVVAYRVPRGGSVSGRRSHCPACGTMIRGRDNVPVLGWLLLGGRCYACRGWISARYPIVEAIMAAGVMLLATRELATNGQICPGGCPAGPTAQIWCLCMRLGGSWRVLPGMCCCWRHSLSGACLRSMATGRGSEDSWQLGAVWVWLASSFPG